MKRAKRIFKRNTHNFFFKGLAGFGRSMNRFYENRNHDVLSNGELTVIKKLSQLNPSVIIDGGANVGNYGKLVNEYIPDAQIFSFEPVEETYNILKNSVKDLKNIIPIKKGLFSENCSKEINLFSSDTHSSLFDIQGISYESTGTTRIDLINGDQFINERSIDTVDLLKLDLEGAEYDALKGFENAFQEKKIKLVQFEYGYINITTKKLLIDFYNFFNDYGYIVGKVFPKTVEFRKYKFKHEDFLGPNFLAVEKSNTALIDILTRK